MREINNIRELQKIEYGILCHLADFLEEHQLTYFLPDGTLLGVVRHQGFIPWHDDINILMPRADYERLEELARRGQFQDGPFRIGLPGNEGHHAPYTSRCRTPGPRCWTDLGRSPATHGSMCFHRITFPRMRHQWSGTAAGMTA